MKGGQGQVGAAMNFNYRNRTNQSNNYHFQNYQNAQMSNHYTPSSISNSIGGYQGQSVPDMSRQGINNLKSEPRNRIESLSQPALDPRERKMREREERIRQEKQELEQLQSYNPFGKGGSGAPQRDKEGNIVATRRPFSQVREVVGSPAYGAPPSGHGYGLHSSHSNSNLRNNYNQPIQASHGAALNQSIDVGQLHSNYYQQAYNAAQQNQKPQPNQTPNRITKIETPVQREEKYMKQLQYQEILKQQMDEKKQKEDAEKRRRMEEDIRHEQKIKEEIERERQIQLNEKLKKEQKQQQLSQQNNDIFASKPKAVGKLQHSPVQSQNSYKLAQVQEQNGFQQPSYQQAPDIDNNMFRFESKRQLDMNLGGGMSMGPSGGLINQQNSVKLKLVESNFENELQRLKHDMVMQQQQFENQLKELRQEAQKNIDYRVKAEQELQRVKSQRESVRPSPIVNSSASSRGTAHENGSVRRSMAGMNNYEKMFFNNAPLGGGAPSVQNQLNNQMLANNAFVNRNQEEIYNPGLGGKFEGSVSLRADSTFVPLLINQPTPQPQYQEPLNIVTDLNRDNIKLPIQQRNQQMPQFTQSIPMTSKPQPFKAEDDLQDLGLHQLENAINEIAELNMGENYKQTQKELQQAREITNRPTSKQISVKGSLIPEYRGIQKEDKEITNLVSQFQNLNQITLKEQEDLKKEYLMRNIQLGPIMETSSEQTFPSQAFPSQGNGQIQSIGLGSQLFMSSGGDIQIPQNNEVQNADLQN